MDGELETVGPVLDQVTVSLFLATIAPMLFMMWLRTYRRALAYSRYRAVHRYRWFPTGPQKRPDAQGRWSNEGDYSGAW